MSTESHIESPIESNKSYKYVMLWHELYDEEPVNGLLAQMIDNKINMDNKFWCERSDTKINVYRLSPTDLKLIEDEHTRFRKAVGTHRDRYTYDTRYPIQLCKKETFVKYVPEVYPSQLTKTLIDTVTSDDIMEY